MFGLIKKIFGTHQSRLVKKYKKIVEKINSQEEKYQLLSDSEVQAKTQEFRERIAGGESVDALLVEAYAVVRNACRRLCGTDIHVSGYDQKWDMVPYDVQLVGGIALHFGAIAEMQTGEGKTLTAALPLYLNALTGLSVHLVTVNDYLAARDCQWMAPLLKWLGMSAEALVNSIPGQLRKQIYAADIVYGTASEFGFDYLRDNSMVQSAGEQCQRGHYFAVVDEVDSILIDEARTPLIISGPTSNSRQMYDQLKSPVAQIVKMQRDLCSKLATEARKTLESLGRMKEEEAPRKLSKEEDAIEKEAFRKLWLVGKGMPNNNLLQRIKENPSLRGEIEKWDTYFYSEPNKEERAKALGDLYLVVDERAHEYELTDKGSLLWSDTGNSSDDFVMLDLGHGYAQIDQDKHLDEQGKLEKKIALREEDAKRKERSHNLRQLLRAHLLMEKDVDYIIADEKIVIIDENTGRPQPGRRFSDGLHQAIEAKEGVSIQGETQTYATITLQNYFRMYKKLAGMTGTAMTEANEFKEIYKLEVLAIPTNKRCSRDDANDEIYMSEREKYQALLKEIQEIHGKERPILIGTESVDISEKLSRILKQNHLEHTVLNAKNHAKEAEIIAMAGQKGAITVATNMAGRGTDIKLQPGVAGLGGLHVIGTTRHQSRRIDRQLRGRCARQGDPGSSKFYVSFEDSLMRLFTSPRITKFLQRFRPPEGEPITAPVLNKSIETAQKRVEQRNYQMRKHTLEYDDVMNKQRGEIYAFRNDILHHADSILIAKDVLKNVCIQMSQKFFISRNVENGWNPDGYRQWLMTQFPVTFTSKEFDDDYLQAADIEDKAIVKVISAFEHKLIYTAEVIGQIQEDMPENMGRMKPEDMLRDIIRNILVRTVDRLWQEHLLRIDHLRAEMHLRAVGQKDPLVEFKHEAFALFDALTVEMEDEIAHALFKFQMVMPGNRAPHKETGKHKLDFRTSLASIPHLTRSE